MDNRKYAVDRKGIRSFRDIIAYQKAYDLSLEIHRITLGFPKIEQFELASQLRRATKSICANIAEGDGKGGSAVEFKRYLRIALGSSSEVRVHLKYCKDLGYLTEDNYSKFDQEYVLIAKMLSKLTQVWK